MINIVDNSGEFGFLVKAIKKAVVKVAKVVIPVLADFPWALVSPIVMAYQIAENILAYKNYKYNKSRSTTKIVYDQSDVKMKFGLTTIAKMGCGVVALHNLLCLLDKKSDLAVISYLLETRGYIFGYVGASIFTMGKLLKELGIKNKTELFPSTVDSKIKKSKVAIIAYLHSNGGHFITVKWNEKRKTFEIYNGRYKVLNSVDSFLNEQKGVLGIIYLA